MKMTFVFDRPFDLPRVDEPAAADVGPGRYDPLRQLIAEGNAGECGSVAVDVDGILWSFCEALGYRLRGRPFRRDECQSWAVFPETYPDDVMTDAIEWCWTSDALNRFGLWEHAARGLTRLRDHGLRVVIATRRHRHRSEDLAAALARAGVPYDELDAQRDLDKIALCVERGIGMLVDDKPATIRAALDAGLEAATIEWPYNAKEAAAPNVLAAADWDALAEMLLARLQNRALNR